MANAEPVKEETKFILLSEIHADFDWNSRHKSFRDEKLPVDDAGNPLEPSAGSFQSLLNSIRMVGQDDSVVVRPSAKGKKPYELVVGFRRYQALVKSAEEKINVPVPRGIASSVLAPMIKVEIRNLDEKEARALNGRENIERENLSTCDQAFIVKKMVSEGMSDLAIASATGMSNGHISQLHRIADGLHETILERWRADKTVQSVTSLDRLEKISKLSEGEGDKKRPARGAQEEALNELLESKTSKGGNKGKWIESAIRQAAALGTFLGTLDAADLIDCSKLNLDNPSHAKILVAGDILLIKGKDGMATDSQWQKIAAAASAAYDFALNPPEESEEGEEAPKTGTKKKVA